MYFITAAARVYISIYYKSMYYNYSMQLLQVTFLACMLTSVRAVGQLGLMTFAALAVRVVY